MKPPTPPETVAAIIADYAAGISTTAAAVKYGISSASAHRYVAAAGINRSHAEAKDRAKQRAKQRARREREKESALTGGRWVRVGLVHRWVVDEEPEPVKPPEPIACPCGARLSEPCRTTGGNWTRHAERLTSRRCPCGNVPREGSHYCTTECRDEARAETYRAREQRNPTRQRRRNEAA